MGTYVNNLRLLEITTGDESGTWGTKTNTNLELIADAFGSGTEAITTNADTHTTTIADGAADEGRALFLKYTGTLDSACTITIAPNTVNKLWFIENATSGSQNIIISQGSGANITIGNGKVAAVYTDGAGSGAAVLDVFADLEISSTLTVGDDLSLASDAAVLNFGADSDVSLTHVADTGLLLNSTRQLQFNDASQYISGADATTMHIYATDSVVLQTTLTDINGNLDVSGTSTLDGAITSSAGATITVADNSDNLTLTSTDADATAGPNLRLYRNSGSPADNDHLGEISFDGRNDNSQDVIYANIETRIKDASDGSEDGYFDFETMVAGTLSSRMIMNEAATIFNEDSLDLDFRVESNGQANMLFVDAGNDRVGIKQASPGRVLDVEGKFEVQDGIVYWGATADQGILTWDTSLARIGGTSGNKLELIANGSVMQTINTDGTVAIGADYLNVADGITTIGGTDTSQLRFLNAAGTLRSFLTLATSSTSLEIDTDSDLILSPNNAERMRINSSGQVGIGTSAPGDYYTTNLVIAKTSSGGRAGISIVNANDGTGRIDFADGTSGAAQYRGTISYAHDSTAASGYMRFVAGGSEALRLGSNYVLMANLPTSDPGVANSLYNDSGTLKISAG